MRDFGYWMLKNYPEEDLTPSFVSCISCGRMIPFTEFADNFDTIDEAMEFYENEKIYLSCSERCIP